ncbi:sugar ABC transporter permease [Candidatus Aerophobetes bacterium]|uniref:Sugar ABC transporter permease n=1 Tax=Aerophobetes bacterium TaxID=2030807 RepID=A0A662D9Q9_UNCAE|nr:MAG: sugar ABC transporter permease [Candidatus Aerophobetes bacterium]
MKMEDTVVDGISGRKKVVWLKKYENSNLFPVSLVVPVLVFFVVWNIIPLLWMTGLSFYNYSMVTGEPEKFIGFRNYLDIISNSSVWRDFGRTFLWMVTTVGTETVLGLVLGFLFWNSAGLPGRRVALTLLFSPMLLAPAGTGTFFRLIYEPTFGVINYFLVSMGFKRIDFLGDLRWAFPSVALVDIWMWTPFMILITLAALGAVPKAELEAARVDKIPWFKRLIYIIFPYGKFILMLGIILRTIESFKTMDLIYLMTKGGPGDKTELIAIDLWRKAFEGFTMGWSSAVAVIMLLTAIAFTSVFLYILKLSRERR